MNETRHRPDFLLFLVVIVLSLIGLVAIYSSSMIFALQTQENTDFYFFRQLMWVGLGLFLMLFTMNVHYRIWQRTAKLLFLLSYFLLAIVLLFGVGGDEKGASRWIPLGPFTFQPSDLAMLSIILYLAYLLTKKEDRIKDPKASFWPSMILIGIGFGLIMLEPDMDTAVTFAACPMILMIVAGVPWKYMCNSILFGIVVSVPLAMMGYRGDRISAFWNPWEFKDGIGYQIIQSLYAIGTGGWTGRGLGHSIEKFSYLPEAHTDFIFAIFSEEWGFIGGLFLIALYGVLIWRGIHVAMHVQNRFASLVAIGITSMIAIAVFLNIGSVTKLLPVIGVPLPFISYGGTSLILKMLAMGILLNISRYTVKEPADRPLPAESGGKGPGTAIPIRTSRFDT